MESTGEDSCAEIVVVAYAVQRRSSVEVCGVPVNQPRQCVDVISVSNRHAKSHAALVSFAHFQRTHVFYFAKIVSHALLFTLFWTFFPEKLFSTSYQAQFLTIKCINALAAP